MTFTIDAPRVLDVFALAIILLTAVAVMKAPAVLSKLLPMVMLAVVAAALIVNCAPAAQVVIPEPTLAKPVEATSADFCVGLITIACQHDAKCSGRDVEACVTEQAPPCGRATGITEEEAIDCALAMKAETCPGTFPLACVGIMGDALAQDTPATARSL
mgnify:CR=1 FL=1